MIQSLENPHGGDIYSDITEEKVKYDFSSNVSPLGTPGRVKKAAVKALETMHLYPDPYCRKLVKAAAVYEKVEECDILFGNGASELIYAFAEAIHPQKVLIMSPTFCEYENSLKNKNCLIKYYDLNRANEFEPDYEVLDLLDSSYDVVYICNPNNPTGKVYKNTFMKEIAQKCMDCGIYLFVDECFGQLSDEPENYSLKTEIESNRNLIILKAFTKSFGMAGVRLGYCLCSDDKLLRKMSECVQTWSVSSVAQAAGVAALQCTEILKLNREIVKRERKYLIAELRKLGIKVYESHVNFILFESKESLSDQLLASGILIRKCDNFRGLAQGNFYRCAVKSHDDNVYFIKVMTEIYS